MVREVDDRVLIARRFVRDRELVVIRETVDHGDVHRARITARAVRARQRELDARVRILRVPQLVVEAGRATVDVVLLAAARIEIELVRLAIQHDLAARDAVRMTADDTAHARIIFFIIRCRVIAEQDIIEFSSARHLAPLHEARAIRRDRRLRALRVPQRIEEHFPAIAELAERFLADLRHQKRPP